MKKLFATALLCCISGLFCLAQQSGYRKTSDGLIVYPAQLMDGNSKAIRLTVFNDHIIRVTAAPVV